MGPEVYIDALQDRIHTDIGKSRPAKVVSREGKYKIIGPVNSRYHLLEKALAENSLYTPIFLGDILSRSRNSINDRTTLTLLLGALENNSKAKFLIGPNDFDLVYGQDNMGNLNGLFKREVCNKFVDLVIAREYCDYYLELKSGDRTYQLAARNPIANAGVISKVFGDGNKWWKTIQPEPNVTKVSGHKNKIIITLSKIIIGSNSTLPVILVDNGFVKD